MSDRAPDVVVEAWLSALGAAEQSLESLGTIYPSRMYTLPESGFEAIKRAMNEIQDGVVQLHRAGRYVLGPDEYESFVLDGQERDLQTEREEDNDG